MAPPSLTLRQRLVVLAVVMAPLLLLGLWLGSKGFFATP